MMDIIFVEPEEPDGLNEPVTFKPREIMKLYRRRMQIEQNFRDEKSERFGFGLRASYSRSAERIQVLSLLATLSTIVLWLLGYHAENKGLHLRYQANY